MSNDPHSKAAAALPAYCRKIISASNLSGTLKALKSRALTGMKPKTVVQCHGCFDIVHPGHIRYLQFARAQGDILVVSITGDSAMDKGELRPYIPQELRAESLAALEFVDYVVVDPHPTAREILSHLRPDIYVKGQEYAASSDPRFLAEREIVESYGGRVIYSSGQVVFSSTRLVESVAQSTELESQRLEAICRRHDISHDRLGHVIEQFRGRRILVFGDSIIERYVLCDAEQIASEAPMMALNEIETEDYLGGAAFVALQAAAFGADVVLVTGLGDDAPSEFCRGTLESFGVSLAAINRRRGLTVNTRFLVDDRKLLGVRRKEISPLDSVEERRLLSTLGDLCGHADAVIVHGFGSGLITPALLQHFGQTLRAKLRFLAFGADVPQGEAPTALRADLVCCSERRLRAVMHDADEGLSSVAYRFLQKSQAERMLVTLGKRGIVSFERPTHDRQSPWWGDRLRSDYLPTFARHVVDQLGVSDSMLVAATLAMAAGSSLMQAAYLAEAVAASAISTMGSVPVTSEDISLWLDHRPELARSRPGVASKPTDRMKGKHAFASV